MLREVTRPDKSCVSFQYDTFGRRIEKSVTSIHSKGVSEGRQQKVIRFLWNGNNLFHEWEEKCTVGRRKTENKVDFKADYILKLEKREEEKAKKEAGQGENIPDNLITWVFQDGFIPRGKITKDGNYSIISDYLGTPVEAYDEEGKKVWERNLDIYGRVKTEEALGEKNLIPFRFQGQYEDEETGLYYNRFRYYSPEEGCYTQQDPIGLAGGNPTLYGYVYDTLCELDPFGLAILFETGTYGGLNSSVHVGDGLQAHELIRHKYLVQKKLTSQRVRLSGNPAIALDNVHHTRVGGAHWWETQIRKSQGLGRNQFHPNLKRELDITQGGLRKAGYPASQARKLRKEAEKFYKRQTKLKCLG